MNSPPRCVRSRNTCGAPVRRISATMARETTSRGASSFVKRSPAALRSRAPSPRSASESRKRGAPSTCSAVGWNCTNSMSQISAPGAPRHGHAVAGGDVRIGGVPEDAAQAAGGEQHGARADARDAPRALLVDQRAGRLAVFDQQVRDHGVAAEFDVGQRGGLAVERAGDLAPGGIAVRVQHAVAAVRAFAREGEAVALAVELRAPLDQLLDGARTLLHQRAHGVAVAQPVAGGERVLLVQFHFVVVAERHGDAALRVLRGGFAQRVLGHHQHAAGGGQFDGRAQSGYSGADHEEIRVHWLITSLTR